MTALVSTLRIWHANKVLFDDFKDIVCPETLFAPSVTVLIGLGSGFLEVTLGTKKLISLHFDNNLSLLFHPTQLLTAKEMLI